MNKLYVVTALYKKLQTNLLDISVETEDIAGVFKVFKTKKTAEEFVNKIEQAQSIKPKIIEIHPKTGDITQEKINE